MTENTALSHMTPSLDERHGSVGVLLPNLECKVKDLLKAPIIFHRSLLITLWGSEDFVCVTLKFTRPSIRLCNILMILHPPLLNLAVPLLNLAVNFL